MSKVFYWLVYLVFMNSCLYHLTIYSDIMNIKRIMLVFLYKSRRGENQGGFFQ